MDHSHNSDRYLTFHVRAANALGWTLEDVQSMGLRNVRENLRTVDDALAAEATEYINIGRVLFGVAGE